jgi:hypothetical protein
MHTINAISYTTWPTNLYFKKIYGLSLEIPLPCLPSHPPHTYFYLSHPTVYTVELTWLKVTSIKSGTSVRTHTYISSVVSCSISNNTICNQKVVAIIIFPCRLKASNGWPGKSTYPNNTGTTLHEKGGGRFPNFNGSRLEECRLLGC